MEIGNQMQNHKIETNSELILYMKMEAFDWLHFFQNYRQRYTVISITTVRGPLQQFRNSGIIESHPCTREPMAKKSFMKLVDKTE